MKKIISCPKYKILEIDVEETKCSDNLSFDCSPCLRPLKEASVIDEFQLGVCLLGRLNHRPTR